MDPAAEHPDHDIYTVRLNLEESSTFRTPAPAAAVPLRPMESDD